MIEGIYTSASSMLPRTFQQVIEADNIANAQVPGHKRSNVFIRTLADASQYLTDGPNQPQQVRESEGTIID
jgi:flagellar basal body rod protein FlgG